MKALVDLVKGMPRMDDDIAEEDLNAERTLGIVEATVLVLVLVRTSVAVLLNHTVAELTEEYVET